MAGALCVGSVLNKINYGVCSQPLPAYKLCLRWLTGPRGKVNNRLASHLLPSGGEHRRVT